IQDLGCICCSALDVICGIGTRVPGGQAAGGPNAFRHCSSPGRRARLLAAAIFLLGLMSAHGAWGELGYWIAQQSAGLFVAFLVGLVVAAALLRAATRNIVPRSAMAIAALAIPIWVVYFASSQGRSLLASEGFLNTMPDALWFGLTFGVFTAAFFLALGYIYGDAKRRQMPAWAWVIAAFLIPNLIGFILYFLFRGPLLGPCSSCGKPIRGGEAFCSHCGCSQGSSIGRITADTREKGV